MPEGPEIRRMVDDIDRAVGNRDAESVFFAFDRFKRFESALAGRHITRVAARGKAVLIHFAGRGDDGPWCVYSHNQLYGKWYINAPDTAPQTNRQLRFAVFTHHRTARLYSASDIRLVRPDALDSVDYIARLGPDPLNENLNSADIAHRINASDFARRNLGGLLLDQRFIAGIGNYLRSEILFSAGIAPGKRPTDLDATQRRALAEAVVTLIWRAYQTKGVTNPFERAQRLKAEGKRFGARRHMVFGRAGQPCYVCDNEIVKTTVASRRLYYCPVCQQSDDGG
ncbi:endonuclease VIII [Salinisphaera sp. Q1T1-3]|uniref:endonuclease VIII n=1 Tax=Salinisphaera sp. Q1T1-3 TaxID=2321229 RepID=UPI000E7248AC|nr:endonuclease VIII [Salinisphaera sp. Q1T1-3]RJS91197.1 endonuclease VIII [Salinisphaera sp. Q1T1-3]